MVFAGGVTPPSEAANVVFSYDRVYKGLGSSQMLVKEMTEPLILQFLKGFNTTVSLLLTSGYCSVALLIHGHFRHSLIQVYGVKHSLLPEIAVL